MYILSPGIESHFYLTSVYGNGLLAPFLANELVENIGNIWRRRTQLHLAESPDPIGNITIIYITPE